MARSLIINCRMLQQLDVGLGSYTARLIKGLARHAPAWKIVCLVPEHASFKFPPSCKVVIIPLPRMHPLLGNAWFDLMVDRIAARHFPDAVLFNPMPAFYVRRPHMTCMTYHDCIPIHFPLYLGRKVVRRVLIRLCDVAARRCQMILTVSDHARYDIIQHIGIKPERIHTVHNWLPPEYNPLNGQNDAERVRKKYGLPLRFWLYIGGYDVRKNVDFAIRAYSQVRAVASCPSLVLAGRIPNERSITTCDVHNALRSADLINGPDISMPGLIAPEDMPGLYGSSELLIFPSLYEGFGMTPLEAMGCGCPAIVADTTSLPEVVRDTAYRFDTNNTDQLALMLHRAAVGRLPLNPSYAPSHFSEEIAIEKILSTVSKTFYEKKTSILGSGNLSSLNSQCLV